MTKLPDFEDKTNINHRVDELFEQGMREGKHGHLETQAIAWHTAYAEYLTGTLKPRRQLSRDELTATQRALLADTSKQESGS